MRSILILLLIVGPIEANIRPQWNRSEQLYRKWEPLRVRKLVVNSDTVIILDNKTVTFEAFSEAKDVMVLELDIAADMVTVLKIVAVTRKR